VRSYKSTSSMSILYGWRVTKRAFFVIAYDIVSTFGPCIAQRKAESQMP